jgi:hypothetical protein
MGLQPGVSLASGKPGNCEGNRKGARARLGGGSIRGKGGTELEATSTLNRAETFRPQIALLSELRVDARSRG